MAHRNTPTESGGLLSRALRQPATSILCVVVGLLALALGAFVSLGLSVQTEPGGAQPAWHFWLGVAWFSVPALSFAFGLVAAFYSAAKTGKALLPILGGVANLLLLPAYLGQYLSFLTGTLSV